MFVSSLEFTPRANQPIPAGLPFFGTAAGADYKCTAMAANAGLIEDWNGIDIDYKAVMATNEEDLFLRLQDHNGVILNTRGEEIGTGLGNIFDYPTWQSHAESEGIYNAVRYDEFGNEVATNPYVWTGATAHGDGTGLNAGNWEDPVDRVATVGDIRQTDGRWLNTGTRNALELARFYCLEIKGQRRAMPTESSNLD